MLMMMMLMMMMMMMLRMISDPSVTVAFMCVQITIIYCYLLCVLDVIICKLYRPLSLPVMLHMYSSTTAQLCTHCTVQYENLLLFIVQASMFHLTTIQMFMGSLKNIPKA